MRVLVLASIIAPLFLPAQQPNTVTVTVSSTQAASAALATFRVQFFDASLSSTIDTALVPLTAAGVTASQLTGISVSLSQGFVVTQYDFSVQVPMSQFAETRDRLIAAQRSLANVTTQGVGWSTSYSVSEQETARVLEQALPGLLTRARQQAGVVSQAINASAGAVQSVSAPAVLATGLNLTVSLSVTFAVQ